MAKSKFLKRKRIRVEFYDAESGAPLGYDEMRPKKIPYTFEYETHVTLNGKQVEVIKADPMTMQEAKKEGYLRIDVRAEYGDTPTIEEMESPLPSLIRELPDTTEGEAGEDAVRLHTDYWRESEFVHQNEAGPANAELASIAEIIDKRREDGMFPGIHMRERVRKPFAECKLSVEELQARHFPQSQGVPALVFSNSGELVQDGFALRLPSGAVLYGLEQGGTVECLAWDVDSASPDAAEIEQIQQMMDAQKLWLIDWNTASKLPPSTEALQAYFARNSHPGRN